MNVPRKQDPTVSVIIPVFNGQSFIEESIQSALRQTHRPYEIIVVDDGSTDSTLQTIKEFGRDVTVLTQSRRGAACARNLGASHARGEWLAFLDADDVWLPTKLERQLTTRTDTAVLVWTDRINIGELDGLPRIHSELQPMIEGDVFLSLIFGNVITTSSVMVQTQVFRNLGGFCEDPAILPAEDWDLWLRIAETHSFSACGEALVQYRLHPSSISRNPQKMNSARRLVLSRALSTGRGRALSSGTRRRIRARMWNTNGWDAARHHHFGMSLLAYLTAAWMWPFDSGAYAGIIKSVLKRG